MFFEDNQKPEQLRGGVRELSKYFSKSGTQIGLKSLTFCLELK